VRVTTTLFSLIEYSITAEFNEGDPAYDWIINFIVRSWGWGGVAIPFVLIFYAHN